VRIIAGRYRGRRLKTPAEAGLAGVRPTADRTREALFDILAGGRLATAGGDPLVGRRVLDAFAGTGALGLEALSRGAGQVVFLERDRAAAALCRANIAALGAGEDCDLRTGDALHPPPARSPCDLVLMDPPYGEGLAAPALQALAAAGWLSADALVALEQSRRDDFSVPPGFEILDERRYGRSRLIFLRRVPGAQD